MLYIERDYYKNFLPPLGFEPFGLQASEP